MTSKRFVDLYYEDVDIGDTFDTASHTVTHDDIMGFAHVTLDHHPLHTDPEFCARTEFGRPIAHGLYGLSLMEGLKAQSKMYENTSIASLGWDKVRFLNPLFPDDTVFARVTFIDKRLSRSGRGIVTERCELINDKGEMVISSEHVSMLKLREAEAAKV